MPARVNYVQTNGCVPCGLCSESQNGEPARRLLINCSKSRIAPHYGIFLAQSVRAMAYREFRDSAGLTWRVWDTLPTRPQVMDAMWRDGWLTFQSGSARRRLAPIPTGWADESPNRLELMCKAAQPAIREMPARGSGSSPGDHAGEAIGENESARDRHDRS